MAVNSDGKFAAGKDEADLIERIARLVSRLLACDVGSNIVSTPKNNMPDASASQSNLENYFPISPACPRGVAPAPDRKQGKPGCGLS
jgi:hypothetical protein